MVQLTPSPIQRFVDANGNALVGGQLFTYAAGTTTKTDTYTDSTGSTPQTNPIILNARGEPQDTSGASVGIWLAENTPYKFVLAPATDTDPPTNPIWTLDNIVDEVFYDSDFEFIGGPPTGGQLLRAEIMIRTVTYPGNFVWPSGVLAAVGAVEGINPAATFVVVWNKNGVQVGTMTISTGGSFSFVTAGGNPVIFNQSDVMSWVGPATPDTSISTFLWTISGTPS